jgi:hypothetical protein
MKLYVIFPLLLIATTDAQQGFGIRGSILNDRLQNANSECPTTNDPNNPAYNPDGEQCEGLYENGQKCDYNYFYTGCTWDELQCVPTAWCTCNDDGMWMCAVAKLPSCDPDTTDPNLPTLERCVPDEDDDDIR